MVNASFTIVVCDLSSLLSSESYAFNDIFRGHGCRLLPLRGCFKYGDEGGDTCLRITAFFVVCLLDGVPGVVYSFFCFTECREAFPFACFNLLSLCLSVYIVVVLLNTSFATPFVCAVRNLFGACAVDGRLILVCVVAFPAEAVMSKTLIVGSFVCFEDPSPYLDEASCSMVCVVC